MKRAHLKKKRKKKWVTRINCQIVVEISKHASSSVTQSHETLMVSLFRHPSRHDLSPRFLSAFIYSFFFSFCLSSLLISLLAMDVYFEMMPYWFMPGKSSRKLTVRERNRGLYQKWNCLKERSCFQNTTVSKPHPQSTHF